MRTFFALAKLYRKNSAIFGTSSVCSCNKGSFMRMSVPRFFCPMVLNTYCMAVELADNPSLVFVKIDSRLGNGGGARFRPGRATSLVGKVYDIITTTAFNRFGRCLNGAAGGHENHERFRTGGADVCAASPGWSCRSVIANTTSGRLFLTAATLSSSFAASWMRFRGQHTPALSLTTRMVERCSCG